MTAQPVRIKLLLEQQHWQTYRTFRKEYDKAAKGIDPELIGSAPSRAQFYRWVTGDIKGLPFPDHCRVLERMFPGMTAAELFETVISQAVVVPESIESDATDAEIALLTKMIDEGLEEHNSDVVGRHPAVTLHARSDGTTVDTAAPSIAPSNGQSGESSEDFPQGIARRLAELKRAMRLPDHEIHLLAALAGDIVELEMNVDIDIADDGWARLTYRHHLLNLGEKPLTRIPRELWFEHTRGRLTLTPINEDGHRAAIERVHDTPSMSKFACRVSPPIRTGETGVVGYVCEGGRFVYDHYWRQSIARHTRHFTLRLRHRGAEQLVVCTAVEEHADGSENSATDELMWDYEEDDVVITLTRDHLHPGQAVTLRWDVGDEDPR
ncbi:hypothetical protein J5X84_42115 [Streptosporangiaceae bacterium NEAU-GS5]|nr:hypothetical protein [Streptosporangiaceae bacterium NEAU-GS5]